MVDSNDYINLNFNNQDWLDKPHFPFWLTALSYKIFGINSFAYILPGFIFNLIGAYYTFLLAKHIYNQTTIGLIAVLLYLTTLHLMTSAIDVRAEAFLMGEIIPATYYLLKLFFNNSDGNINRYYPILAAFFMALALMTKGIFTLVPILSGISCLWVYDKKLQNFISLKFLLILSLSFIFILPELICLYWQFDLHPEKLVFNHTKISGIHWFFIDSQFGRFFNNGPIENHHGDPSFFIHTFLWAFLPWSMIFIVAIYQIGIDFKSQTSAQRSKNIYLLGAFFPTFIMFTMTKFQLDHYTNIIFPIADIVSANYIYSYLKPNIDLIQKILAIILIILMMVLSIIIFNSKILLIFGLILYLIILKILNKYSFIYSSVMAISSIFIFIMTVNAIIYSKYDAGYQIASKLNDMKNLTVYDYNVNSASFEFKYKGNYSRINQLQQIKQFPCYLLIAATSIKQLKIYNYQLIVDSVQIPQEKFIITLFNHKKFLEYNKKWLLIKITS